MPTTIELLLWRYGAIALTTLPILVYTLLLLANGFRRPQDDPRKRTIPFLILTPLIICGIFHPIIRLIIAVDAVYLLRDLPTGHSFPRLFIFRLYPFPVVPWLHCI